MLSKKHTLDLFLKLVKIDSVSGNESAIRTFLVTYLKKNGYHPRVDKKGNILVSVKGPTPTGPTILFNAHMDTVAPGTNIKPIVKKGRITSDGTTILGADDKSGITGILEMLRLLKEEKVIFKEIKIIFTVEEEIGLIGARSLTRAAVQADYCFVLDGDGDIGSVVNRTPSQDSLTVKIRGKAAHAGANPEQGISAIKIAAEAIFNIRVGRIDSETTANIGIIKGGIAKNIIPDEVLIIAEARSHSEAKLKTQVNHMVQEFKKAAKKHKGKAEIQIKRSYNRIDGAQSLDLIKINEKAAKVLGLTHTVRSSCGGSDASIIYSHGIPTIALCPGMEKVHTNQEYITLKNLTGLPRYLVEIVIAAQAYKPAK